MWIYTAHGRTFAVLLQSCRSRVAVVAVSLLSRRKSCTWLALANGKAADWLSGNPLSAANYWISGAASRNTITSLSHYVRDVIIIIISSRRQQRCPVRASAPRRLLGSGLKKKRSAPFPGRMSWTATKSDSVLSLTQPGFLLSVSVVLLTRD